MKKKNIFKALSLPSTIPLISNLCSVDSTYVKKKKVIVDNDIVQQTNINTIITVTDMGAQIINPTIDTIKAFIYQQAKVASYSDLINDITITIDPEVEGRAIVEVTNQTSIYTGNVIISWTMEGKVNLPDVLVNRVGIISSVTSDKNSLIKSQILSVLKIGNPTLDIEQLDVDLSNEPTTEPQYDSNTGFWYVNVFATSKSTFYNAGNVAINICSQKINLDNYIRNQNLGVLEVKDESISADDIKNEIMKMNVHIDVEFLATITISDIAKISGKDYEYSAQVMCDTNKAYFINPDQNTITINLFGIEDNHIAFYKINDDGTKTWDKNCEYYETSASQGTTITDGVIPQNVNTIYDRPEDGLPEFYPMIVKGRLEYDGIIFRSNNINYYRYCTYDKVTLDLSKISVQDPFSFKYDVHAGTYSNLYLGNLNLVPTDIEYFLSWMRYFWQYPPPVLEIYSTRMSGIEILPAIARYPYFTPPEIILHLPFGSAYMMDNSAKYESDFDWTDSEGVSHEIKAGTSPNVTVVYDNN